MLVGRSCCTGLGPRPGCRAQRPPALPQVPPGTASVVWPAPALLVPRLCDSWALEPSALLLHPLALLFCRCLHTLVSFSPWTDVRVSPFCPAPNAPCPSSCSVGHRSLAPQACARCRGQGGEEGGRAEWPGPRRWQAVRRSYSRTPAPGATPQPSTTPQPPRLAAAAPRGRALPGHPPSLLPVAGPASPAVAHCVLIMRRAGGFFALRELACVAKPCPAASRLAWKMVRQAGASPEPGSLWASTDRTAPCRAPCDTATATARAQATVWPPRALGDSTETQRKSGTGQVGCFRINLERASLPFAPGEALFRRQWDCWKEAGQVP